MTKTPHSVLSSRVLFALSNKPANSIAALARELDSLRPSVSRAVNTLQDAGLITRKERTLSLTDAGIEEVQRLRTELPDKVKKATDLATRALERVTEQHKLMEPIVNSPGILAMQSPINSSSILAIQSLINSPSMLAMQSLINSPSMLAARSSSMLAMQSLINNPSMLAARSSSMSAMQSLINSPALRQRALLNESIFSQLASSIASIAQIQQTNLGFLQLRLALHPSIEYMVIENNVFISRMLADLAAIAKVSTGIGSSLEGIKFLTIDATAAYNTYFRKVSDTLSEVATQPEASIEELQTDLIIPTTTTSSLVSSARNIIQYQPIPQPEASISVEFTEVHVYSQQYTAMSIMLEDHLNPLSNRFVSKWHGAWQTLASKSEDRYSQAMHSGRELLMQILDYLAPNELFTADEIANNNGRPPTRRMRVKRILGSSTKAEWVDKTAAALDSMYDVLAADSHNREDTYHDDITAAGQLIVLGGLLLTLLRQQNITPL